MSTMGREHALCVGSPGAIFNFSFVLFGALSGSVQDLLVPWLALLSGIAPDRA